MMQEKHNQEINTYMRLFSTLKNQAVSHLEQYKQRDPATYAAAQQAIGGLLIVDGFIGIDNPLAGKKRPGIFGTVGLVVLGIIFMLLPSIFGSISGYDKMTAQTTARVVSVSAPQVTHDSNGSSSSSCMFTAAYDVHGKSYQSLSTSGSSNACQLTPGRSVAINYNPNNPAQWGYEVGTMKLFMAIFFWAGVPVVLIGVVTFIVRLLSIVFGWKLLKSGRALAKTLPEGTNLSTVIAEIKNNFSHSVFGAGSSMVENAIGLTPDTTPTTVARAQASPEQQAQPAVVQSAVQPEQQATPTQPTDVRHD